MGSNNKEDSPKVNGHLAIVFVVFALLIVCALLARSSPQGLNGVKLERHLFAQLERKAEAENWCKNRNKDKTSVSNKRWRTHSILDTSHNVFYCEIPQTESSIWLKKLREMTGFSDDDQLILSFLGIHNSNLKNDVVKKTALNMTKVTSIKHPYVRISDVFDDIILKGNKKKWRSLLIKNKIYQTSESMSFEEFVRLIVKTKGLVIEDTYPMWFACNMCYITYDYLTRAENAGLDTAIIFKQLGLQSNLDYTSEKAKYDNSANATLARISQLPKELEVEFRTVYQNDFGLFQYDPNNFNHQLVSINVT